MSPNPGWARSPTPYPKRAGMIHPMCDSEPLTR